MRFSRRSERETWRLWLIMQGQNRSIITDKRGRPRAEATITKITLCFGKHLLEFYRTDWRRKASKHPQMTHFPVPNEASKQVVEHEAMYHFVNCESFRECFALISEVTTNYHGRPMSEFFPCSLIISYKAKHFAKLKKVVNKSPWHDVRGRENITFERAALISERTCLEKLTALYRYPPWLKVSRAIKFSPRARLLCLICAHRAERKRLSASFLNWVNS